MFSGKRYMQVSIKKENNLTLIDVSSGDFIVTLCDLGASLYGIKFHNDEMILRVKDSKDFLIGDLYYGKTIGRICGRVPVGPFDLEGQHYEFADNNNGASLHGGFDGLSTKTFDCEIKENKNDVKVTFSYLSKDKESGYPGNLLLKVIYTIKQNFISLQYKATVDKPCLFALTNHAYFNLGESDRNLLKLTIPTSKYIDVDEVMLPVRMLKVKENWNFKKGQSLSQTGDIDNYFLFDGGNSTVLESRKYRLTVKSDFQGVQIYTDNFVCKVPVTSCDKYPYRCVAIEPEDNQLDRKVLRPNEEYERNVEYRFELL